MRSKIAERIMANTSEETKLVAALYADLLVISNQLSQYSETKGRPPMDWNEVLQKDCKNFSKEEAVNLVFLSGSWVTCACGSQCAIIPRYENGLPKDDKLIDLGYEFNREILFMSNFIKKRFFISEANKARRRAIKVLQQIEKRSTQIIKHIL